MLLSALFDDARARLADAPRVNLGRWQRRRILGVSRAPRIVPAGTAWHLGVLLLGDDAVLATGEVVRAREDVRRGFAAQSQRERAEIAAAAFRGGFPEGAVVHLDWQPIDLDAVGEGAPSGPLSLEKGVPAVRWSASGGLIPLEDYLAERIALLCAPPPGA